MTTTTTTKIIPVGNSKGIRLPANLLKGWVGIKVVELIQQDDLSIILRPYNENPRVNWAQAFIADGADDYEWADFETSILEEVFYHDTTTGT